MSSDIWPAMAIVLFIVALVLSKVLFYVRKSDQQWQDVDKSKLRVWEDDDET